MKNRLIRTAAALLAVALVMLCASCRGGSDPEPESGAPAERTTAPLQKKTITLPYSRADGLDPFEAKTHTNIDLAGLLYEGLFDLSVDYTPVPVLASTCSVGQNAMVVKLAARSFNDGSPVTASDVVYSFELAKDSSAYGERLDNIERAYATAEGVVFELDRPNFFAVGALDFPIVRLGTAGRDTAPVGSGKYVVDQTGEALSAVSDAAGVERIELFNVFDSDSLITNLELGRIDMFSSELSDGDRVATSASIVSRDLCDLVYLGLNSGTNSLSKPAVRRAISLAVDRAALAGGAWQGYASPALTPTPTAWNGSGEPVWNSGAEISEAYSLLVAAGYALPGDPAEPGEVAKTDLSYRLIVSEGNRFKADAAELIASELASVGIGLEIKPLDEEDFTQYLENGWYDLYLGEIRMTRDMSLRPFFDNYGATSYGVEDGLKCEDAYDAFMRNEVGVDEFNSAFYTDAPFVPLVWRCGVSVSSPAIHPTVTSVSNCFDGIYNW